MRTEKQRRMDTYCSGSLTGRLVVTLCLRYQINYLSKRPRIHMNSFLTDKNKNSITVVINEHLILNI